MIAKPNRCPRCGGMMFPDRLSSLGDGAAFACLNCGHVSYGPNFKGLGRVPDRKPAYYYQQHTTTPDRKPGA